MMWNPGALTATELYPVKPAGKGAAETGRDAGEIARCLISKRFCFEDGYGSGCPLFADEKSLPCWGGSV